MSSKLIIVDKSVYGVVRWFNEEKACGRINIEPHGEVFVHLSKVKSCGSRDGTLKPNQRVRCDVVTGPKGLQAVAVEVVQTARARARSTSRARTKGRTYRNTIDVDTCSDATGSVPDHDPDSFDIVEKDLRGEVTKYNWERGFGFILVRQYGSIFCHVSHVIFSGVYATKPGLKPTQIVKCDVKRDSAGQLAAVNVHVICEATATAKDRADEDAPRPPGRAGEREASKHKQNQDFGVPSNDTEEKKEEKEEWIVIDQLGEVKEFRPKQNLGFLQVQGYDTVFVSKSSLVNVEELRKGQVVKCDIVQGPKSPIALNVRVIAGSDPSRPFRNSQRPLSLLGPPPGAINTAALSRDNRQPAPMMQLQTAYSPYPTVPMPPPHPQQPYGYRGPPMPPQQSAYPYSGPPMNYHRMPSQPPLHPMEMPPPYQEPNLAELERLRLAGRPEVPTGAERKPRKQKRESAVAAGAPKGVEEKEKTDSLSVPSSTLSETLTCAICEDRLDDPVTTPCEHLFCRECIEHWLDFNPSCPVDGKALSRKAIKQAPLLVRNLLMLQ